MSALVGALPAPLLHVMTFNIRRRLNGPLVRRADRWPLRSPRITELLQREQPTIVAVQEAFPDQAEEVARALGSGYRRIGHGRARDGRGEANPLFVDERRLDIIEGRQRALSDSPDVAGSRSWGNPLPRTLVQAEVRDRETGARFSVLATHLDPFSARSRLRSVDVVRSFVSRADGPVIVMGDLNAPPGSPTAQALLDGGMLRDAWTAADRRLTPEWDTFADYRTPRARGRRIDWIAVSGEVEVDAVAINASRASDGWASDHLPVQAVLRLPEGRRT